MGGDPARRSQRAARHHRDRPAETWRHARAGAYGNARHHEAAGAAVSRVQHGHERGRGAAAGADGAERASGADVVAWGGDFCFVDRVRERCEFVAGTRGCARARSCDTYIDGGDARTRDSATVDGERAAVTGGRRAWLVSSAVVARAAAENLGWLCATGF